MLNYRYFTGVKRPR